MLLLDLKARGMTEPPKLATGDGSLGFWLAMSKVFPSTRHQRCWVHKTMNVLDKLPKISTHACGASVSTGSYCRDCSWAGAAFDRALCLSARANLTLQSRWRSIMPLRRIARGAHRTTAQRLLSHSCA